MKKKKTITFFCPSGIEWQHIHIQSDINISGITSLKCLSWGSAGWNFFSSNDGLQICPMSRYLHSESPSLVYKRYQDNFLHCKWDDLHFQGKKECHITHNYRYLHFQHHNVFLQQLHFMFKLNSDLLFTCSDFVSLVSISVYCLRFRYKTSWCLSLYCH